MNFCAFHDSLQPPKRAQLSLPQQGCCRWQSEVAEFDPRRHAVQASIRGYQFVIDPGGDAQARSTKALTFGVRYRLDAKTA